MHNGELKNGASYTTSTGGIWKPVFVVKGFRTKEEAKSFEKVLQLIHKRMPVKSVEGRIRSFDKLINMDRWSKKRALACTIPLTAVWFYRDAYQRAETIVNYPSYVGRELATKIKVVKVENSSLIDVQRLEVVDVKCLNIQN